MKGFKVITTSDKGSEILQLQIKEREKQPLHTRMMLKQIFSIKEDLGSLTFTFKSGPIRSLVKPKDLIAQVKSSFEKHGGKEGRDYKVEVF